MPRTRRPPRPIATGGRVLVRRPGAGDRTELRAFFAASAERHRRWVDPVDVDAYLARARRRDVEALLACAREDGAIVGCFTISQIVMGPFRSASLGFTAHPRWEGRGVMSEALPLVLGHAFGAIGLHRIEANIQPANARSIALVRRAGFRHEGFSPRYLRIAGAWRDHERWAITAEDRG